MEWKNQETLTSKEFKCGHCGREVASNKGYYSLREVISNRGTGTYTRHGISIYLCHNCDGPNIFNDDNSQIPGRLFGDSVKYINDPLVNNLYEEARRCYSVNAYTSVVMCCRKLLMNIAVSDGAKEGKSFAFYIDYLEENRFIPQQGNSWVDQIRKLGNQANHKINQISKDEAELILVFTMNFLKVNYEMPGLLKNTLPKNI